MAVFIADIDAEPVDDDEINDSSLLTVFSYMFDVLNEFSCGDRCIL